MKTNPMLCTPFLSKNAFPSGYQRLLAGLLPLLLAACTANDGFQLSSISLDGLFGSGEPVPSHVVADIGITRCDRLTTDDADPDRARGVAQMEWDDLDATAAVSACEQALAEHPGHRRQQAQLARAYLKAYRYDDAYAVADEAVGLGSIHALYLQGAVYRDGRKDKDKAIKTYARAAEAGHVSAMSALAWLLYERDGWGDRRKAKAWFQKAATAGSALGMAGLGDMYILMDKEFGKAFPWYQRAADQGNIHTQNLIGLYYAQGLAPVAKEPDQALQHFERAARGGHAGAGVNAARLYIQKPYSSIAPHSGHGGVADPILESERKDKALYWLKHSMPKLSIR